MVTLATDHVFRIGEPHIRGGTPCQDYAVSGMANSVAYAVVSDGCSTGRRTDVGSRILVLSAEKELREDDPGVALDMLPDRVRRAQLMAMDIQQLMLGLIVDDMKATSAFAVVDPDLGGVIHLQGDGVIALAYDDGSLILYGFKPEQNAPAYLAYQLRKGAEGSGYRHLMGGAPQSPALKMTHYQLMPDDDVPSLIGESVMTLADVFAGFTVMLEPDELKNLRYVAVFTDGVTQVGNLPWWQVVRDLLAIKSKEGQFAVRRMSAFLRDAAKRGHVPGDDIGYAVIKLNHDTKEEA